MSVPSIIYGDLHVTGRITGAENTPSAGSIRNNQIAADAAIDASKVGQQVVVCHRQPGAVVTQSDYVHVARGAGEIVSVRAVADAVPAAANSYTIDVQINGVSALSSVVTINDSTTADSIVTGTLGTATYVAGDLVKVIVTTTGGGSKGTGLLVQVITQENPNP